MRSHPISKVVLVLAGLVLALAVYPSHVMAQANPVPLINQPLVPTATAPGGPGFTLTVNGTGFTSGSVVNWNGNGKATTFVSSSQIRAAIPASDIAAPGTASIMVRNPSPGGGMSNLMLFPVVTPTSSISMSESVILAAPFHPYAITVGDFNGDGKLDFAAAEVEDSDTSFVGVYLGNGDGTFQPRVSSQAIGTDIRSIVAGDFNGDGKLDLAVGCTTANHVVNILLGNGDGTFQMPVVYAMSGDALGLATGDFNGDGKLDLAATGAPYNSISILLGNGDGTFQPHVDYAAGPWNTSVATGDFNKDGKLDLAVVNNASPYVLSIYLGNGDGTFQPRVDYPGIASYAVVAADFNGDGNLDLAVVGTGSDEVSIYLGKGDGTVQSPINNPYPNPSTTQKIFLAAGDFNGDGKLDLVASGSGPPIIMLLGSGDGTFQSPSDVSNSPYSYEGIAAGDFNGDGRLDLIAADFGSPGDIVVLLQVPPAGDYTPPTTSVNASPGPNSYGWNNTNVTVNLNATDNPGGSGVKQIQFALGGAQNTGWQTVVGNVASVTISAEGTTTLSYFATDNVGNQETAKTLTVRIDKTPPMIFGLPAPGCTIWPPNHKLVQVATVTASDALSGLAPGSFKVIGTSSDLKNGEIVITGGPTQFLVQLGADKDEVYTLTATASDLAGNVATKQAICSVPHDQGK